MKTLRNKTTEKTMVENKKGMDNMKEFERINNVENNLEEANDKPMLDVSCGFDMSPLYRLLLAKCGEDIPTLVVLDELPEECCELKFGFAKSITNPDKLILMICKQDSFSMKHSLLEAIEAYQNQRTHKFASAYHPEIILSDMSNMAHIKSMYEHALKIALALKIPCPQIIMHEKGDMVGSEGRLETHKTEDGIEVGRIIHISKNGRIAQLRTLAHELRHCWQHCYTADEGFTEEINLLNAMNYYYHKTEIDAEAYSCLYVKELKGYADVYSLLPEINSYEVNKYVHTIMKRMEEISLAA